MTEALPREARIVIIGGGIIGCSVAYHLTKLGIADVLLLERKKLTSGTTWHAAGLVRSMLYSANLTRLAQYTVELYRGLEAETGQATGFRQQPAAAARHGRVRLIQGGGWEAPSTGSGPVVADGRPWK